MGIKSRWEPGRVGKAIREVREKRGLTQGELSRKAGLGKGHLSTIESGKGDPSVATVRLLAQALEVSIDSLVIGSGEQPHAGTKPAA